MCCLRCFSSIYDLSQPSKLHANGLSFACERRWDANLAGRLKVLIHPSIVHLMVFNSEGNFLRPGEKGVMGVSAVLKSSSDNASFSSSSDCKEGSSD
jgi:hypothetical protein